jgi:hypothetical protein
MEQNDTSGGGLLAINSNLQLPINIDELAMPSPNAHKFGLVHAQRTRTRTRTHTHGHLRTGGREPWSASVLWRFSHIGYRLHWAQARW